jgi:hypothetical protein
MSMTRFIITCLFYQILGVHMGYPEALIDYHNGLNWVRTSLTLVSEDGTDLCPRNVIFNFYFKYTYINIDKLKCEISLSEPDRNERNITGLRYCILLAAQTSYGFYGEKRAPVIKQTANDVTKHSVTGVPCSFTGSISPQQKRPERKTDHSTQYSAKVILCGIKIPPPCLMQHSDKFPFHTITLS